MQKKINPANSTGPAWGAAGGGGNSLLLPGPLHQPFGGKTQPVMAFCWQGCSPAPLPVVAGTRGIQQAGQSCATPRVSPQSISHMENAAQKLYLGSQGENMSSVSHPAQNTVYVIPKDGYFLQSKYRKSTIRLQIIPTFKQICLFVLHTMQI